MRKLGALPSPRPSSRYPQCDQCSGDPLNLLHWDGRFVLGALGTSEELCGHCLSRCPFVLYFLDLLAHHTGRQRTQGVQCCHPPDIPRSQDVKKGDSSFCLMSFRGQDTCHEIQGRTKAGFGEVSCPQVNCGQLWSKGLTCHHKIYV